MCLCLLAHDHIMTHSTTHNVMNWVCVTCLSLQMHLLSGSVSVNGTLAYVSQQAWIFHGTVRDNILMGEPFDQTRYNIFRFTVDTFETHVVYKTPLYLSDCELVYGRIYSM